MSSRHYGVSSKLYTTNRKALREGTEGRAGSQVPRAQVRLRPAARGGARVLCWASPHVHAHLHPKTTPQLEGEGREEQRGAPGPSEGLKETQNSEQKGQKVFTP